MFVRKLIIGLLSFYAVEVQRYREKHEGLQSFDTQVERLLEEEKKREQIKKKTKLYDKRKWKKKQQFRQKTFAMKGTNPKDVRFSNQQKIRRMFRNS